MLDEILEGSFQTRVLEISKYGGMQRERDKPRQAVVANTLELHRNRAVGFIAWLDVSL